MEKARKKKMLWLLLGIFSSVTAAVGTPLLAWFALRGWYVPTALFVLIVGHGFYGIPFYFRALYRASLDIACLSALADKDSASVTEISGITGITEDTALTRLRLCIERGYIRGYTLNGNSITKTI